MKALKNLMPKTGKQKSLENISTDISTLHKSESRLNSALSIHAKSPSFSTTTTDFNGIRSKPGSPVYNHNHRITYMTPTSLEKLRNSLLSETKNNTASNSILTSNKHTKTNSLNIQLEPSASEYVYEDLDKAENERIRKNYEEYRRVFQNRLVLDKKKNLLYTKPEEQTLAENEEFEVNTDRIMRHLEEKYKGLNPEKLMKQMIKDPEPPKPDKHFHRDKLHIENLRVRSKNLIDSQIKVLKNNKIATEAKNQIDKITVESAEIVDKLTIENHALKNELEILRAKCEDLQAENGILIRKNQLLMSQINQMREAEEQIRKNHQNLESLKPIYQVLKEKFPHDDIKTILAKFDRLQNMCLDYSKRIDELEVEKQALNDEKNEIKKEVKQKEFLIKEEEMKRNKIIEAYRSQIETKELDATENNYYKENYKALFNKVINIFMKWSQGINVFDGKNLLGIKPDLKDPLEMLDVMEKMIRISTSKDLQEYLKKIMVSANLLLRKFFPGSVNDRFDPDKIYEKITKYIESLHSELRKYNPRFGMTRE